MLNWYTGLGMLLPRVASFFEPGASPRRRCANVINWGSLSRASDSCNLERWTRKFYELNRQELVQ